MRRRSERMSVGSLTDVSSPKHNHAAGDDGECEGTWLGNEEYVQMESKRRKRIWFSKDDEIAPDGADRTIDAFASCYRLSSWAHEVPHHVPGQGIESDCAKLGHSPEILTR